MKSVLVPTDFSEYATGAIKMANIVSRKTDCSVLLQHNIKSLVSWNGLTEEQKFDQPLVLAKTLEAERKLDDTIKRDFTLQTDVQKLITHGVTYEAITSSARDVKADLIILGSHGNERSDRYFIGSNVQRVIRHATCPVLAVKQDVNPKEIHKIVFPFQFGETIDNPFGAVKALAHELKAEIDLLYVNTPSHFRDTRQIREEMTAFQNKHQDIKLNPSVYNHHDPVTGILEYCEEAKADMIALVTHDRRYSVKYLIGITESLVFHSTLPVLSVNTRPFEKSLV